MLISETRTVLASMLDGAGMTMAAAADVRGIVEVFRRFASLPVDGTAPPDEDGDGVLAQFGTYDFADERSFSADLTRQFIEAGGQDPAIWQLSCTLSWLPRAETDALGTGHLWSFGTTLDEFFGAAVALPGWVWSLGTAEAPRDLAITLSAV